MQVYVELSLCLSETSRKVRQLLSHMLSQLGLHCAKRCIPSNNSGDKGSGVKCCKLRRQPVLLIIKL